jgi:hypothetical protein
MMTRDESDDETLSTTTNEPTVSDTSVASIRVQPKQVNDKKDSVKSQIDAIVTSCFASTDKQTRRKVKLGKRTAADDQDFDDEEEYLSQLTQQDRKGRTNRSVVKSPVKTTHSAPF